MGIWDRIKSAFGGGGGSDRGALYIYVRCSRCRDVVRVRINMANELQQEFAEGDGVSGYSLRKGVVDSTCFRRIEVTMTFDGARRERSRSIDGGEFVDEDAYTAAQADRQRTSGDQGGT